MRTYVVVPLLRRSLYKKDWLIGTAHLSPAVDGTI
jgi:hypothetical protein